MGSHTSKSNNDDECVFEILHCIIAEESKVPGELFSDEGIIVGCCWVVFSGGCLCCGDGLPAVLPSQWRINGCSKVAIASRRREIVGVT